MNKPILFAALLAMPLTALADEVRQHGAHVHGEAKLLISTEGEDLLVVLDSPAYNLFGFEHKPSTDAQQAVVDQALATLRSAEGLLALSSAASCSLEQVSIESDILDHDDHGHGHDDHGHDDHGHGHDDHDDHGHDDHGHGHDDHGHDDHGHGHDDHGHDDHGHGHDDHGHDDHGHGHDDHGHDDHGHGHDDHGHDDHGHGHDDHGHDDHGHSHDHDNGHADVIVEWTFHCDNIDQLTEINVGLFEAFPNLTALEAQYLTENEQGAAQLSPGNNRLRF